MPLYEDGGPAAALPAGPRARARADAARVRARRAAPRSRGASPAARYSVRDPRLRTTLAGHPAREPARARRRLRQERPRARRCSARSASATSRSARSPRIRRTATRARGSSGSRRTAGSSSATASRTRAPTRSRRRLDAHRADGRVGVNLVKTNDPARPAVAPDVYEDYAASFARAAGPRRTTSRSTSAARTPPPTATSSTTCRGSTRCWRGWPACDPRVPVFLKLKPTHDAGVLREIVAIADGHPFVSGFAINLPAGKPDDLELRDAARRRWSGCRARSAARRSRRTSTRSSRRSTGSSARQPLRADGGRRRVDAPTTRTASCGSARPSSSSTPGSSTAARASCAEILARPGRAARARRVRDVPDAVGA